jgi:hypothetical protein
MSACLKQLESLEGECVPFLKASNLRHATEGTQGRSLGDVSRLQARASLRDAT